MERYDVLHPRTGELAKFNLNFVLATALRYGKVDPKSFDDEEVDKPEIKEAIGRIRLTSLPSWKISKIADPARYLP